MKTKCSNLSWLWNALTFLSLIIINLSPSVLYSAEYTENKPPVGVCIQGVRTVQTPSCLKGTFAPESNNTAADGILMHPGTTDLVYNAPMATIAHVQAEPGTLHIPVIIQNFNDAGVGNYSIEFNPSILSFTGLENAHPNLSVNICNNCTQPFECCVNPFEYLISSVTNIDATHSMLFAEYYHESNYPGAYDIPDGDTLFEMVFEYTGGFTELTFTDGHYYFSENMTSQDPVFINEPFADYYFSGSVGPLPDPPVISNSVYGYIYETFHEINTPVLSYQLTAANLTDLLVINAVTSSASPSDCQLEISFSADNGFASELIMAPVNGLIDTTIYLRPACTTTPFDLGGTITHMSSGAETDMIDVYLENTYLVYNAPIATIPDVRADPGTVRVPVTIRNFVDAGVGNYSIEFNPSILSFTGLENAHPNLEVRICNNCLHPFDCCVDPFEYLISSVTNVDPTHSLLFAEYYHEINHQGTYSIPDGDTLFEMVFEYTGGITELTFTDGHYFYSGNGISLDPVYNNEPFADYYFNGSVGPFRYTIDLELNLEGLYNPAINRMNKARNETGVNFPGTIADQVTIQLARDVFPYSVEYTTDSVEVDQDGQCSLEIPGIYQGNYYLVVLHRNSIETWSKYPVTLGNNPTTYSFSASIGQAYNDNLKLKNGKYCIYAGDVNQDGFVDSGDMSILDNEANQFMTGYNPSDVNGDGFTDTGDINMIDNNTYLFTNSYRPLAENPEVLTSEISQIHATTAQSGGTVISQGSSPVLARGVCWNISPNPTIADYFTSDGAGAGSFVSLISGLLPNTTYYVRSYATNSEITQYGAILNFQTGFFDPGSGAGDIDGNIYTSVILGTQEWMVENLRTSTFANGDAIPLITDNAQWAGLNSAAWSWYGNNILYENPYGKLYNWFTVVDSRNLCPVGWHVPTDAQWTILTDYLGGLTTAGNRLKETGFTHWVYDPYSNATNQSGFTGLPGGYRYIDGTFSYLGYRSYWWSATDTGANPETAFGRSLGYNYNAATRGNYYKKDGISVRCLKN